MSSLSQLYTNNPLWIPLRNATRRENSANTNDALSADTDWYQPGVSTLVGVEVAGGCRTYRSGTDEYDGLDDSVDRA
jgi:hypothetical protein